MLGKGASEQKGTMAAMLHALEAVRDADILIDGRLVLVCCVSGETGKHDAIRHVVEQEVVRADLAFVYGNGLKLQLGNRGRVDLKVVVRGVAGHSSRPHNAANAVTGAVEVLQRLATEPRLAAELGRRGVERARLFSWHEAAAHLAGVFRAVLAEDGARR